MAPRKEKTEKPNMDEGTSGMLGSYSKTIGQHSSLEGATLILEYLRECGLPNFIYFLCSSRKLRKTKV